LDPDNSYYKPMKKIPGFAAFTLIVAFAACKKDNFAESKDALHERFNGKYQVISSWSDQQVDINLDGKVSSNLKDELSDLSRVNLELRILKEEKYNLFSLFWPEQYLSEGFAADKPIITFANQALGLKFNFSKQVTDLLLDSSDVQPADAKRFVLPSVVKVLSDDVIEVSFSKSVYTSQGWKNITIITRYKRWTRIT
jgi:hypothetical protein